MFSLNSTKRPQCVLLKSLEWVVLNTCAKTQKPFNYFKPWELDVLLINNSLIHSAKLSIQMLQTSK